jgi:hypothetical protein
MHFTTSVILCLLKLTTVVECHGSQLLGASIHELNLDHAAEVTVSVTSLLNKSNRNVQIQISKKITLLKRGLVL